MRKPYRVVNLIKNQLYPTYQLHAYLSNKKTIPQDGLRLGALLTLDWLWAQMFRKSWRTCQIPPHTARFRTTAWFPSIKTAAM